MAPRKPAIPTPLLLAAPAPLPEFIQGAFWTLQQLKDVLWERRRGMHVLEALVSGAAPSQQRLLSDIIEPLAGGVQQNVLETVMRRLEDRVNAEAVRRTTGQEVSP